MLEYKGYKLYEEKDRVIAENVRDFNPVHIFECGQCFRWLKQDDRSYTGVAKGKVVNLSCQDNKIIIYNSNIEDFINIWFEYLDLGRDYSEIKKKLDKDEIMHEAIRFGCGIRLLKQDIWETLVSFILSANNKIPRIMRSVAAISQEYGDELQMDGTSYYSFPGVDKLSGSCIEELEICKGGFRCKYILNTSEMVKNGQVDMKKLAGLETEAARNELQKFPGVGPKVADCVLLYSGTKDDVFPTDVWVKRVMEELYFKRDASFKEIQQFSREYFGGLAGYAQQYLFYYARENRIGSNFPGKNV